MADRKDRRHILFLTHYFAPEGNAPASRTFENCRRWVADGHRVTVITGAPNVPSGVVYEGYRNRLVQTEWMDGIRVIRVWTLMAANRGTLRRTLNFLSFMAAATVRALFVGGVDVVIATSPQFFCGWAGVLASKLGGHRFLLEIRDLWPESIETVGAVGNRLAIGALSRLEEAMYRAADRIVTVGGGYRRKLIERGVPAGRIAVVTNGADLDVYVPGEPDEAVVARYGLAGKFTVAYVGTLGMACGLDCVLDAAETLRAGGDDGVRFLLVGDGARRAELEAASRARDLTNVWFTGRLGKEEIPPLLRSVDACLVHLRRAPLFETVLPSKIFEAFAMGRPILIGVPGDATAVVERARGGLAFEPENADDLLEKLGKMRADPALRAQLGKNGRRCVEREFSRDALAADYSRIIESLD